MFFETLSAFLCYRRKFSAVAEVVDEGFYDGILVLGQLAVAISWACVKFLLKVVIFIVIC